MALKSVFRVQEAREVKVRDPLVKRIVGEKVFCEFFLYSFCWMERGFLGAKKRRLKL